MAKTWMKFTCKCGLENWINEDPKSFAEEELIVSCCKCGHVLGFAKAVEKDDKGENCCVCLPFKGTEQGTNGPHGDCPMTDATVWATANGAMLTRSEFMKKFGKDPYVDWCEKNPNSPFCVNFKDRCKNHQKPTQIHGPDYIPDTQQTVRPKKR
jgi:hypothetical protein